MKPAKILLHFPFPLCILISSIFLPLSGCKNAESILRRVAGRPLSPVIKSFCHLASWAGHWRNLWCLGWLYNSSCLVCSQRMSIVLLYFFTKKILRLFVPITTQQDFPTSRFSDPWRVRHQAGEYSTVPMIHTFSMWPTLRNTIYLLRITSLGHQHSELSFPATNTLAPILCIVYILPPYDSGALAVIGDERLMVCVTGSVSRGKIFQSLALVLVVEEVFPFFPRRLQSFFSISRRQLENQFSRATKNKRKTFCEQFSSVLPFECLVKIKKKWKTFVATAEKKLNCLKTFW